MMKSVLITGCSSGFGMLAAVTLAKNGFRVFATMRNLGKRGRLDEALAKAMLRSAGIGEIVFLDVDVDDDGHEPLVGYLALEQSQVAVDMARHRLIKIRHLDLKWAKPALAL
jgi:NAD(P)-dependent dehydrogenase (short-subunit alcohol dehydrogenase family)